MLTIVNSHQGIIGKYTGKQLSRRYYGILETLTKGDPDAS